jgi:hypothetical protein
MFYLVCLFKWQTCFNKCWEWNASTTCMYFYFIKSSDNLRILGIMFWEVHMNNKMQFKILISYWFNVLFLQFWRSETDLLMLGFRFISWLLLSASSTIETRPRCFTNLATASSSSGDIYINFPRSSTTPARINYIIYLCRI